MTTVAAQDVLAVVEVDAGEPLGAVGQLDRPVEARQDRVEAARLQRRGPRQLGARDPAREAQVVLDAVAGARLASRAPGLGRRTCGSPSEPAETAAASPAGPPPSTTRSKRCPSTSARRPSSRATWAAEGLRRTRSLTDEDGGLLARDLEPVQDLVRVGVEVDVVEAERDEVALQQVAHLEGAARAALGDEAQDAVPRALVPGAAGQEAAQHQLAHLRRGRPASPAGPAGRRRSSPSARRPRTPPSRARP